MRRTVGKLSIARVKTAKPKPGRDAIVLADGGNLYLQVTTAKDGGIRRSWTFRYEIDGRRHELGLGPLHTLSLSEARDKARTLRQQLLDGDDPLEARQAKRAARVAESAKAITFAAAAASYMNAHRAGWRNATHSAQWASTLSTYAYPVIGPLAVTAIDTPLVLKVLEPIWATKPETASRLRGRIESVLSWATARGHRDGDNPARWRGHLDHLLPARAKVRRVEHHPALPYTAIPAFMADLRARTSISARALEFTTLTAARTSEVLGARWAEFDLDDRVWLIPGERMKAGRDHRVPLSDRAVEILRTLPHEAEHVFARDGGPLSNMAMLELMRGARPGFVPHGLRSSFRDWTAEQTAFPNEVAEAALAHVIGDKAEAAYRRGDLFDKRRKLMASWAAYCAAAPARTDAKVTPIRKGGGHA